MPALISEKVQMSETSEEVTCESSAEERLSYLSTKRIRIMHKSLKDALVEFEELFNADIDDGRGMIFHGASGTGKTSACELFINKHPRVYESENAIIPIIQIRCPEEPTAKGIKQTILEAYGAPNCTKGSSIEAGIRIKYYIKLCNTKMIIVDECQQLLSNATGILKDKGQEILDYLKILTYRDEGNVSVILVGTEDADKILTVEEQILRRFCKAYHLTAFRDDSEFSSILSSLEPKLLLQRQSNLASDSMQTYVWNITKGRLSGVMSLVKGAAKLAIKDGTERITVKHLEQCKRKVVKYDDPRYKHLLDESIYN